MQRIYKINLKKPKKQKGVFKKQGEKEFSKIQETTLQKFAKKIGIGPQQQKQFTSDVASVNKISTNKELKKFKQKIYKLTKKTKFKDFAKKLNLPKNNIPKNIDTNKTIEELENQIFQNQDPFYQEHRDEIIKLNQLNAKDELHWKQELQRDALEESLRKSYTVKLDKETQRQAENLKNTLFN